MIGWARMDQLIAERALVLKMLWAWAFAWDYWVGNDNDTPVLWVKKLLRVPFTGWQLHLHKFSQADRPGCFHSHPAFAWRMVVWGGYEEEVMDRPGDVVRFIQTWRPFRRIGLVRPEFIHRAHRLLNGRASYSLWLRGPIAEDAQVHLYGEGWPYPLREDEPPAWEDGMFRHMMKGE